MNTGAMAVEFLTKKLTNMDLCISWYSQIVFHKSSRLFQMFPANNASLLRNILY